MLMYSQVNKYLNHKIFHPQILLNIKISAYVENDEIIFNAHALKRLDMAASTPEKKEVIVCQTEWENIFRDDVDNFLLKTLPLPLPDGSLLAIGIYENGKCRNQLTPKETEKAQQEGFSVLSQTDEEKVKTILKDLSIPL